MTQAKNRRYKVAYVRKQEATMRRRIERDLIFGAIGCMIGFAMSNQAVQVGLVDFFLHQEEHQGIKNQLLARELYPEVAM